MMQEKKRTLTLLFSNVEEAHLGKDVFLVPYYLGKELGCDVNIYFPQTSTNINLPKEYRGVHLHPVSQDTDLGNPLIKKIKRGRLLFQIFRKSDILMLFHYYSMVTPRWGVFYKIIHPSGKLYVKMDASLIALKEEDDYTNKWIKFKKNCWHWMFANVIDCITCETKASYDMIMNSKATMYKFRKDLFIMPNAFDDEMLDAVGLQPKRFEEKQNLFLTVGRIGAPEKNNEMLLRALSQVDMKDWTIQIVGPYDDKFALKVQHFFEENPTKQESVFFTGNISEKKELWTIYNDSKVFILTSKTEGSPLVFVESNVFRDYILSTDVGSFRDVTEDEKYGNSIPQDDDKVLAEKMQDIIDGKINVNVYNDDHKGLMWTEVIKSVADKLR